MKLLQQQFLRGGVIFAACFSLLPSSWSTGSFVLGFSSSPAEFTGSRRDIRRPSTTCRSPYHHDHTAAIVPNPWIWEMSSTTTTTASTTRLEASPSSLSAPSLIASGDSWGNWMVLLGNAALAQVLGKTTAVGRLLGPPVTAMAMTFAMATCRILPSGGTPGASQLQSLTLNLATPLVLLGADLRMKAIRQCGPLLLSFLYASMATLTACLLGWKYVCGSHLTAALGKDGLIIAAALMAKNIGGGLNYMAVCSSLQASPTAIAAGLCVDNIFALVYFPACSFLASGRVDPVSHEGGTTTKEAGDTTIDQPTTSRISVDQVTNALFVSAALLWSGQKLGGRTGALPVCTLLTVLLASNKFAQRFVTPLQASAQVLGTVALYVFFSTAGAPGLAVADSVRASVVPLSLFLTTLYGIHGLVLWILHTVLGGAQGKAQKDASYQSKLRQSLAVPRLLCASSAAIGGPATAVALAQAADWESLKVPSLLVGNLGYALATFLGLGYHALFSS